MYALQMLSNNRKIAVTKIIGVQTLSSIMEKYFSKKILDEFSLYFYIILYETFTDNMSTWEGEEIVEYNDHFLC